MSALARHWSGRSPSERRVLVAIAAVVAVVLVVALVWLPLERSRERLRSELPVLRASVAALERDGAEVKRLRAMPPAAPRSSAPLVSLATNAGGLPGAQVAVLDERRVRVTSSDMSFAALLEWLRNAQASHGMRVDAAKLESLPTAGRVRGELVLARSR